MQNIGQNGDADEHPEEALGSVITLLSCNSLCMSFLFGCLPAQYDILNG